jgi:hypothetical protein
MVFPAEVFAVIVLLETEVYRHDSLRRSYLT